MNSLEAARWIVWRLYYEWSGDFTTNRTILGSLYVGLGGVPRSGGVEGVEREVEARQRGVCHQRLQPHGRHALLLLVILAICFPCTGNTSNMLSYYSLSFRRCTIHSMTDWGLPRAGGVESVERKVEVCQRGVCHERRHQRLHAHGRHT